MNLLCIADHMPIKSMMPQGSSPVHDHRDVMQSVLKRQQRALLGRGVAYHFIHTPPFAFTRIGVVYCTFAFLSCRTSFATEASGALIMFAAMCAHHCPLQKGKEEGR